MGGPDATITPGVPREDITSKQREDLNQIIQDDEERFRMISDQLRMIVTSYELDDEISVSYRTIDNVRSAVSWSFVPSMMFLRDKALKLSINIFWMPMRVLLLTSIIVMCNEHLPFASGGFVVKLLWHGIDYPLAVYYTIIDIIVDFSIWTTFSRYVRQALDLLPGFGSNSTINRMVIAEVHIKSKSGGPENILYLASMTQYNQALSNTTNKDIAGAKSTWSTEFDNEDNGYDEDNSDLLSIGTKTIPRPPNRKQKHADSERRRLVQQGIKKRTVETTQVVSDNGLVSKAEYATMIGAGHLESNLISKTLYTGLFCNTETLLALDVNNTMPKWHVFDPPSSETPAMKVQSLACKLSKEINELQYYQYQRREDQTHFALRTQTEFAQNWLVSNNSTNPTYAACKPQFLLDRLLQVILKNIYAFIVYTKNNSVWTSKVYWIHSKESRVNDWSLFDMTETPDPRNKNIIEVTYKVVSHKFKLYQQDGNSTSGWSKIGPTIESGSPDDDEPKTPLLSFTFEKIKGEKNPSLKSIDVYDYGPESPTMFPVSQTYFHGGDMKEGHQIVVFSEKIQRIIFGTTQNCLPLFMQLRGTDPLQNFWTYERPL